jgi:hypothetical protein
MPNVEHTKNNRQIFTQEVHFLHKSTSHGKNNKRMYIKLHHKMDIGNLLQLAKLLNAKVHKNVDILNFHNTLTEQFIREWYTIKSGNRTQSNLNFAGNRILANATMFFQN